MGLLASFLFTVARLCVMTMFHGVSFIAISPLVRVAVQNETSVYPGENNQQNHRHLPFIKIGLSHITFVPSSACKINLSSVW